MEVMNWKSGPDFSRNRASSSRLSATWIAEGNWVLEMKEWMNWNAFRERE